ncbi:MAG: TRAP transporter large permease [Gammaproteobacteria bacterium]
MLLLGLITLLAVLLLLRQNLLALLGSALIYIYLVFGSDAPHYIILDGWHALNRDILLSIPLFILSGQIMSQGSMAKRMVRFVRALTGPVPGGLAMATVLSCALFAAISGSSTVTLLAVGSVMYPALLQAGYPRPFALGALCAAGTLGIIVPPSIPLILYGVMTNTSITDLFIAGIGPAIVLTLLMSGLAVVCNWDRRTDSWSGREILASLRQGVWSLFMPILILGGIYSGHFTATESAAVAVVYAFVIEVFVHRELQLSGIHAAIQDTTKLLGALFPVIMLAVCLNVFFTYQHYPEQLVSQLYAWFPESRIFLLATNLFLLLAGAIMDIGSAVLILAPILKPVAVSHGIDPIHFGIIMIVNLEIGYLTPPFGLNLIVAMGAFNARFGEVCKSVIPFLLLMLLGLIIVSFIPQLSLYLINEITP